MDLRAALAESNRRSGPRLAVDAIVRDMDANGEGENFRALLADDTVTSYRLEQTLRLLGYSISESAISNYRRHLRVWGEALAEAGA